MNRFIFLLLPLALSACIKPVIQQGNVLRPEKVAEIKVGDTSYRVETLIGTPVMRDPLHGNSAIYIQYLDNPDNGERFQRRVEITYDRALRVSEIKLIGFESTPAKE